MNPSSLCPRFLNCSVNNCPLDLAYPTLPTDEFDTQKSCPMEKNVRIRIASQFLPGTLKHDGMTVREYAARRRFDSLSLDVRTRMANEGRERLKRYRKDKEGKIES